MMERRLAQTKIRIDGGRMTYNREHRQVADAIGISERFTQTDTFAFGESSDPGRLGGGGQHRGQQSPGGHAIDELETIRDIILNPKIFHQRFHRDVEGARDHNLPQPETSRLLNQLESTGKYGGFEHVGEQLAGKEAHSILGLTLVSFEKQIVEGSAAILIGNGEKWYAEKRRRAFRETPYQAGLIPRIETQRMHKIRADESSLEIVECGCRHGANLVWSGEGGSHTFLVYATTIQFGCFL